MIRYLFFGTLIALALVGIVLGLVAASAPDDGVGVATELQAACAARDLSPVLRERIGCKP